MLSRFVVSQVKHNSYFLVGLVIGLWVALVAVPFDEELEPCVGAVSTSLPSDEFEPQREDKPLGSGVQAAGRSVQRPRYYSTELGMRGSLLAGAMSSEAALSTRAAALNRTAARLQPALKFFITASARQAAPGLSNVVGFTDTREMLKPFHALKYLADNYLEEYDFFFLVSDATFVNARRLTELVSRLSVSRDVYMGTIAEDDSHYCTLDGGILLSNSVLRSVHNELDWCVRNSYSPHHHENLGRCVLHAAHLSCMTTLQGESYISSHVEGEELAGALAPALADAVTVYPLTGSEHFYQLHAYISRVYLERDREEVVKLRAQLRRLARRHPPGYRNGTWPAGLRGDAGLAPPPPDNRFDHLRWTTFNITHVFLPNDHSAVTSLGGAVADAVQLVVRTARAWSLERWRWARSAQLVEGAWLWEPPAALRYRLLLRLTDRERGAQTLRQVEVVRPLGAARLVPVPYVTESARVTLVVPVTRGAASRHAPAFLQRYDTVCLQRDKNSALVVVLLSAPNDDPSVFTEVRNAMSALTAKYRGSQLDVVEASVELEDAMSETETLERAGRAAVSAAAARVARDALLLLAVTHMEFNEDFLNRVRMNSISGVQWFLPVSFARFAQYQHPRFVDANGNKPQVNTGRFNARQRHVVAFYRRDIDAALSEWNAIGGSPHASIAEVLARSPLRCVRAPEPGLVLLSPRAPCPSDGDGDTTCLARLRETGFDALDLGAKQTLAKLLLEVEAEQA